MSVGPRARSRPRSKFWLRSPCSSGATGLRQRFSAYRSAPPDRERWRDVVLDIVVLTIAIALDGENSRHCERRPGRRCLTRSWPSARVPRFPPMALAFGPDPVAFEKRSVLVEARLFRREGAGKGSAGRSRSGWAGPGRWSGAGAIPSGVARSTGRSHGVRRARRHPTGSARRTRWKDRRPAPPDTEQASKRNRGRYRSRPVRRPASPCPRSAAGGRGTAPGVVVQLD